MRLGSTVVPSSPLVSSRAATVDGISTYAAPGATYTVSPAGYVAAPRSFAPGMMSPRSYRSPSPRPTVPLNPYLANVAPNPAMPRNPYLSAVAPQFMAPGMTYAVATPYGAPAGFVQVAAPVAQATRFPDPFFRQYDKATDGYVDSMGFMSRLPLRLQATNVVVHGLVDAEKLWSEFEDEPFQPVLVGGKAIMTIFFNNFVDTDCGGEYLETWYNTMVTPKGTPQVELPADKLADGLTSGFSFLLRVTCADTSGNPGAAMKAICGGREVFGFPKHPVPGQIRFEYKSDNKQVEFDMRHEGKKGVEMRVTLPGTKKVGELYPTQDIEALRASIDMVIPPEGVVSAPRLGGTHKGHNGANQMRFAQHLCCTQHIAPWDPETDSIVFGDDAHYATPMKRWDFVPVLKVHIPDFKIAAYKPNGWISGAEADKKIQEHEQKMKQGVKAGAL